MSWSGSSGSSSISVENSMKVEEEEKKTEKSRRREKGRQVSEPPPGFILLTKPRSLSSWPEGKGKASRVWQRKAAFTETIRRTENQKKKAKSSGWTLSKARGSGEHYSLYTINAEGPLYRQTRGRERLLSVWMCGQIRDDMSMATTPFYYSV